MSLRSRISGLFAPRKVPRKASGGVVRYDAAGTTNENRKHWAEATDLSANAENTPEVRRKLRMRSRYEVANNTYAAGLVRTLVADTVGTGARLQMLTDDDKLNEAVEAEWGHWSDAVNFPLTTRVACGTEIITGEAPGVFRESNRLARLGLPVTLDLRLIEPDQLCDPNADYLWKTNGDDGIVCDADGEVVAYKILKAPPNDIRWLQSNWEYDEVKAENVVHYFQPTRPGQLRGITPLASALPVFAQLRRFTMATLTAAEIAAMLAGVMQQQVPMGESVGDDETLATSTALELVRGMLIALPPGATASQFKPEQPTTNYQMFVNMKLREIGRCLDVPFGKMAGDYSPYNYSSGRLDDQIYWGRRAIDRRMIEATILRPTFYKFCDHLRYAVPRLAMFKGRPWELKHCWHYDGRLAIDPVKDANGDEINLTNANETLAAIAARAGDDWEQILRQRKREIEKMRELGIPLPAWAIGGASAPVRTDGTDVPAPQEKAVAA